MTNACGNRVNLILAEIIRLQESLSSNYNKLAFILNREVTEGNTIRVAGKGDFIGTHRSFEDAIIISDALIQDNMLVFCDSHKNIHRVLIDDYTKISLEENQK